MSTSSVTHHLCPARARRVAVAAIFAMLALGVSAPARADAIFGGNLGYFALRAEDSRGTNDVLFRNLDFLSFDLEDFNGLTVGGEFLLGLGDYVEAGVGAGFYQRTVPSVYADFFDSDGTEIEQDLKLRVTPVTFTARVFPIGRRGGAQPYIGGGVAVLKYRYTETGEFIDFNNRNLVFRFMDRLPKDQGQPSDAAFAPRRNARPGRPHGSSKSRAAPVINRAVTVVLCPL